MKRLGFFLGLLAVWTAVFGQTVPYSVPEKPWDDSLGNHRAIVHVSVSAEAVFTDIPWRREDSNPEKKAVLVTDASGVEIRNLLTVSLDREHGAFVFQPSSGPGDYYVYYLPYRGIKHMGWYEGEYLQSSPPADPGWLATIRAHADWEGLSQAAVVGIQSRTAFDSFFPMEVVATAKEVDALKVGHPGSFMLFPENRFRPIRMRQDLPLKWIQSGPSDSFSDTSFRYEYEVFQVGLFASGRPVKQVRVTYRNSAFPITCFNLEGYNSKGKYFKKIVDVPEGSVQALWFGVDIPRNAVPGWHHFAVSVSGTGLSPKTINVSLFVKNRVLADRGDSDARRGSRLRWLNSRLGIDDSVTHPYTALQISRNSISGKSVVVRLDALGLPASLKTTGGEILQAPISFEIGKSNLLQAANLQIRKKTDGLVEWESLSSTPDFHIVCNGRMESDGFLYYKIRVIPQRALSTEGIRLLIPVIKQGAAYFMGMGLPGMDCPKSYDWKWKGPQNAFWIGNADAGLYCKFRGSTYDGPMLNLYHPPPPPSWYNENKGGFSMAEAGGAMNCRAYTGTKMFKAGDTCDFEFSLLITPVKKVNTKSQFTDRYFHDGSRPAPSPEALEYGVKIINVHQGNPLNPYINYPFLTSDSIRSFADTWHRRGLKVKLYYTIRELTDKTPELWALRSLGTEVLADGDGGGFIWLREHLADHYDPQWFNPIFATGDYDAATLTSGDSRWYNYYIEGLRWLVRNEDIDGVYLDDVAFDRSMLERMRKVMDREKPGCLIDLHSNTGFSKGPATQYTEYFPFINKLWFGESFQYDKMDPANWLIEVSGIPFGLMGDMLQGGGNPWRGMVYGMTLRYPWVTDGVRCDPGAIWKLWDQFGIADASMVGYWKKDRLVTTSDSSVLATAYVKKDRLLIAIGSWAKDTVKVTLNIDWHRIGWKPAKEMVAPAIANFQLADTVSITDPVTITPAKGGLFIIQAARP